MTGSRCAAVFAVAGALWWANRAPKPHSPDARALVDAGVGAAVTSAAAVAGVTPRELGLSHEDVGAGLRLGAAAGAPVLAGWAVASSIPALLSRLTHGAEGDLARWVLLRIPLGTVVTEELLFRSVLYALTRRAWSPQVARAVCAGAFGLWHVRTARRAGDNVPLVLVATTAAGVGFDWLRTRSGSVLAPALVHFAVNAGGALAVSRARR